jgi:hypothetical protein
MKKFAKTLIAMTIVTVSVMLLSLGVSAADTPEYLPGDLNGDGIVDVKDVSMIIRYYRRLVELDETQLAAADVTGDGLVDVKDVSKMIRYYRRLIDSLV